MTRLRQNFTRCAALAFVPMSLLSTGCERTDPPGTTLATRASTAPTTSATSEPIAIPQPSALPARDAVAAAGSGNVAQEHTATEHPGPWLTVLQPSTAIYSEPNAERSSKLGYAQSGARIAVLGKPKPGEKCASGWLQVVPNGFVCSATGTLDDKDPRTKFTLRAPGLDSILPYTYARNAKNGTPLYRSIPTRAQMLEYEPYLRKESPPNKAESPTGESASPAATPAPVASSTPSATSQPSSTATPGAPSASTPPVPPNAEASNRPASASDEERPWWQQDGIEDRLHEIRLSDLHKESDDVLALRMVKGFYVAVDRTFHWNGRTWYKTTKGLVAPADRMGQAAPSDFKGVELGADWHLPIAWVYGGREKAVTFEIDLEKNRVKQSGVALRFVALQLTANKVEIAGTTYRELATGKWIKQDQLRIAESAEMPKEVSEKERWVDVDLSTQTLIVLEGPTPIYATLISSGKSSKIKEKDHATPTGQWRIREKHLTTTMDGDGSAAGDLPYSIEDVPYVMYFHKSYAVHGAFWHRNYGLQMSHGCINLAPLDAKAVFFKTEPTLPSGWHGVWSSQSKVGSLIVVHD